MRKSLIAFVAVAAMVVLGSTVARASETKLTLSSGTSTFDSGASGSSSLSYTNTNFNGWDVTLTSGSSNATNTLPFGIDLSSIKVSCGLSSCESNPLVITFSGNDFSEVSNGLNANYTVAMVTGGASTSQTSWYDASNTLLNKATQIGSTLTFGPVATVGSQTTNSSSSVGPGFFSLTTEDIFSANSSGASFFSASGDVSATPEPRTMLLFGTGLFLVGAFIRRQLHA